MDPSYNLLPPSNEQLSQLFDKVFGLELLREMILDYVIHGDKMKSTISNIPSCRLVNKDWLLSVSRVLLKCQEPLFRFFFSCHSKDQIICKEFVTAVTGPSRLDDRVPPFAIDTDTDFLEKHSHDFSNCLVRCGRGLTEFSLYVNEETSTFALDSGMLLPKMKTLTIELGRAGEPKWSNEICDLIQSLLNACEQLKSFQLDDCLSRTYLPKIFVFPSTITELSIHCRLSDDNLDALGKNLPSSLKNLSLGVKRIPLKDGLITHILQKVQKTLKRFYLSCECWGIAEVHQKRTTTFRLPLMQKLESLEIHTEYLELEQTFLSLEQLVPVLSHMKLSDQTVSALRKWTDSSCFHSVCSFSLERYNNCINFDVCTIENIKRAFPNLRKLNIQTYDADTSASVLKFIMKEMRSLQHLQIRACLSNNRRVVESDDDDDEADDDDDDYDDAHPEFWNALLLGIPLESAMALEKSPKLWEDLKEQSAVSIRNLTDLHTLDLSCSSRRTYFELSNALFTHAFSQMPNLTNLLLRDRLSVSRPIVKAWRSQGRVIKRHWEIDVDEDSEEEQSHAESSEEESSTTGSSEEDSGDDQLANLLFI